MCRKRFLDKNFSGEPLLALSYLILSVPVDGPESIVEGTTNQKKLRSDTWVMSETSPTALTSSRTLDTSRMQPKTADNWPMTLQATSNSWAQTSVENNSWHFGIVIFSYTVDYTGCRVDLVNSNLRV